MNWLSDIASAVGHTVESLADEVGSEVQELESLVGDLASYGMDVFSVAATLGMAPVSFLKALVKVLSGDSHAQLLRYAQNPGLWLDGSSSQMGGHWQTMVSHHSDVKQQIDTELSGIFTDGGSFNYSGPAADALHTTHTNYQNYFTTLVDHAQTQQNRYSTLNGHAQTFLTDVHSTVYSLPAPVAATGVIAFDTAAEVDPAIQFVLSLIGLDLSGMVISLPWIGPDIPIEVILAAILIILAIILLLVALFVAIKDAVSTHTTQQNTTTVPKPTPAPTPTPKPKWPWPDPIPPWLPKDDDECLRHIAQVKAVYPNVRADLIAYLTCLEPRMTPQQVIDLFNVWTAHGMTQQDINNFLARVEENLRLDPGQNQPTRTQIIAFLQNHQNDIPNIWVRYQQAQNIPGIDEILKDMITAPLNRDGTPNPTYRGSDFELSWVANRQTTVGDIVRVEQYVGAQKGPDAVLSDGTFIDTKSYIWPDQTPFFRRIHTIPDLTRQLERYRTDPALAEHPVVYVFDSAGGRLPADIQRVFNNERALGLNVTVQYWPNPNPPQFVL